MVVNRALVVDHEEVSEISDGVFVLSTESTQICVDLANWSLGTS